jgi:hypothetical protein
MMPSEIEDRADFCWKRALEVRSLASTLSAIESKDALLKMADEYERAAEALTRAAVLGQEHDSGITRQWSAR